MALYSRPGSPATMESQVSQISSISTPSSPAFLPISPGSPNDSPAPPAHRRPYRPRSAFSSAGSLDMMGIQPHGHSNSFSGFPNHQSNGPHGSGYSNPTHHPSQSVYTVNSFIEGPGRSGSPSVNELSTQFASASMFDLSQSYLTPHLGANSSNLMPRIKTIELYRKNAKKSNDPVIQFQFAQYMLQTALLSGAPVTNFVNKSFSSSSSESETVPTPDALANGINGINGSSHSLPLPPSASRDQSPSKNNNINNNDERLKANLLKEAVANLRKLSDKGFSDAQYLLGDAYASGALGKPDLKESFSLFQLAAKHGHAEACYRAALCLEEGWGTSKDVRQAIQFLRAAASRSHPGAMLRLGMACFYGRMGLSSSYRQEGIKWLTRASESANDVFPQAPFELAKIYEQGYQDLVFKDLNYAVQLYVKSAELNYAPSAGVLGHAYEYGRLGCPQDAALSIHYYTIAALGGDATSMLAMCAWYMVGAEPVLPRNEEEAYEWAYRAAQAGLAKAQYATGYFLENGIGTDRDILQSTHWYRKAAEAGDERAIARLKENAQMANTQSKHKKKPVKEKDCVIM